MAVLGFVTRRHGAYRLSGLPNPSPKGWGCRGSDPARECVRSASPVGPTLRLTRRGAGNWAAMGGGRVRRGRCATDIPGVQGSNLRTNDVISGKATARSSNHGPSSASRRAKSGPTGGPVGQRMSVEEFPPVQGPSTQPGKHPVDLFGTHLGATVVPGRNGRRHSRCTMPRAYIAAGQNHTGEGEKRKASRAGSSAEPEGAPGPPETSAGSSVQHAGARGARRPTRAPEDGSTPQ